jgi:hypothetical protein
LSTAAPWQIAARAMLPLDAKAFTSLSSLLGNK